VTFEDAPDNNGQFGNNSDSGFVSITTQGASGEVLTVIMIGSLESSSH